MSHISECYYKSKVEKTEKVSNKIIHMCCYELKNGGYLVFKDIKENKEGDELYMAKTLESYAKASDTMPEEMIIEEKSSNLEKLVKLASNYLKD